ncbi:MFS transporter [Mycobacterium aquaticum]|uniref:MFS transporter n=1 Tax=Mycobacterium aquaticum TaxID=1927124 RepID=A0A1X0B4I8_9MYCO|nr:MFS transporter [Mycobacterium aquaticum]ORA37203.1 MFS transporter [Mycobacterium aquaticum]
MANVRTLLKNPAYLQSSTTLLLFFASWGVWWSFFQIWLTNKDTGLGLNGQQVGTVYSVNSLATLVVMFLYGTVQDKLGLKRTLTIMASAVMAGLAPFFIFVYEPLLRASFGWGVAVGAFVIPFGYMAAAGLLEAFSERMSRTYGFEYGQARGWGSFGYAIAALMAGFLFTINPVLNFIAGSIFGVLCLLVQLMWKTDKVPPAPGHTARPKTPSVREMASVLKMPRLWVIIAFVLFSWTFYNLYDQQMFPDFYTSLFESKERGEQVYGVLNSIQVFVEAAMMMLVPILMRKVGVRNTLLLGVSVMCLRILGSAVFDDAVLVSIVKMFHSVEVPLFILGIFRYITLHFPANLSATLYLVGFEVAAQVGNVMLSRPLGSLRDAIGYQPTFYVISAAVFLAGTWAFFALKRDDQDVEGDPFVGASEKAPAGAGT